nr:uncharacterized protein LOC116806890 [Taeniopygia guttata]
MVAEDGSLFRLVKQTGKFVGAPASRKKKEGRGTSAAVEALPDAKRSRAPSKKKIRLRDLLCSRLCALYPRRGQPYCTGADVLQGRVDLLWDKEGGLAAAQGSPKNGTSGDGTGTKPPEADSGQAQSFRDEPWVQPKSAEPSCRSREHPSLWKGQTEEERPQFGDFSTKSRRRIKSSPPGPQRKERSSYLVYTHGNMPTPEIKNEIG